MNVSPACAKKCCKLKLCIGQSWAYLYMHPSRTPLARHAFYHLPVGQLHLPQTLWPTLGCPQLNNGCARPSELQAQAKVFSLFLLLFVLANYGGLELNESARASDTLATLTNAFGINDAVDVLTHTKLPNNTNWKVYIHIHTDSLLAGLVLLELVPWAVWTLRQIYLN